MCQFSVREAIRFLFPKTDDEPLDPTADAMFHRSVVSVKQDSDRGFEDDLKGNGDSESGRPPEPLIAADMGTVESQKKGDFFLREPHTFSTGS